MGKIPSYPKTQLPSYLLNRRLVRDFGDVLLLLAARIMFVSRVVQTLGRRGTGTVGTEHGRAILRGHRPEGKYNDLNDSMRYANTKHIRHASLTAPGTPERLVRARPLPVRDARSPRRRARRLKIGRFLSPLP